MADNKMIYMPLGKASNSAIVGPDGFMPEGRPTYKDYMFLASKIKMRAAAMITFERLEQILNSGDLNTATRLLAESGWPNMVGMSTEQIEEVLSDRWAGLIKEFSMLVPEDQVLELFQIPYDCHNAKTIIKGEGAGVDGTAILSRYPIVNYETVALDTASGYEARACGHARIEVNGVEIDFFNTHLSYEKKELRDVQFAQLADLAVPCRGYIVTGDFNTANLNEFKVFTDSELVNEGKYATFPSSSSAIDNIVLESGWGITDSGMVATKHSDHNLLWAEIHYEG